MGELNVHAKTNDETRRNFIRHLLDDIAALEQMLDNGKIESGITRIGAEQEFCLVNKNWRLVFKFKDGHAYIVNYEDYH